MNDQALAKIKVGQVWREPKGYAPHVYESLITAVHGDVIYYKYRRIETDDGWPSSRNQSVENWFIHDAYVVYDPEDP